MDAVTLLARVLVCLVILYAGEALYVTLREMFRKGGPR